MKAVWSVALVAMLLSGCNSRAGLASIGSQDLPSGTSYRVTGTITVGKYPSGVAVDPGTHTVYVTNGWDKTVSVIDAVSRTVAAVIPVGDRPDVVVVDPITHTVFVTVAGNQEDFVSVIDGSTHAVVATVPVGDFARDLAVDSKNHLVYVAHHYDSLSVIDGLTYSVVGAVPVSKNVTGVAVDPGLNTVYAISRTFSASRPITGDDVVSVIDASTRAVTSTLSVAGSPLDVTVDPSTGTAYVALYSSLSVIDGSTHTVSASVPVGQSIENRGLAVDPGTHSVYVATAFKDSVAVIDGTSRAVTATVPVGKDIGDVVVDPETHIVYVTNPHDGVVSIIENVPG